ncbi:MAG: MarR family winged helix-turn-helix transcriptional regulator [Gemmatimonadaceae bacterium]
MSTTTLKSELRQNRPFHGPEEEAYLSIQRTADGLRRGVSELLKTHGLTSSQYNVLRILRGAGTEGLLSREIGERLVVQEPDVPRLLDRMLERDWVLRERREDDRRCVRVTLTRAGRKLVDSLDAPVQALHLAQFHALGKARLRALLDTLDEVRESTLRRVPPATAPRAAGRGRQPAPTA